MPHEMITRRCLPHWYVPGAAHFVTYRLAGTIPVAVMAELRDRQHRELERIVDYIAWDPVRAKLVEEPHQWFFSSAHDRFLHDGFKSGWLGFAP